MTLINASRRVYGPAQTELKAHEPEYDIRATWGPSIWAQWHACFVRNVPVEKITSGEVDTRGISYAWCRFPDGRVMLVNEGNIRVIKKLNRSQYSVKLAA